MLCFCVKPAIKPDLEGSADIAQAGDEMPGKPEQKSGVNAGSAAEDSTASGPITEVPREPATPSTSFGGITWDNRHSTELQAAVDALHLDKFLGVEFSVTIADPNIPDCPLIACSIGFTSLTKYSLEEIVGKNCRFLLQGVPDELIHEETRFKSRAFCIAAAEGYAEQDQEEVPEELKIEKPCLTMGQGEVLCVQTNARKTGELFRNLFFMKTVDLDDQPFIIGLQAGLGEGYVDGGPESERLRQFCSQAFVDLNRNMGAIERVLASQFRYSGAMRRQA